MAEIIGNNPPVLNDSDYVNKIKNSLDSIDAHDHTTGKGVPISAAALAAGSVTEAKQEVVLANASKFVERDASGNVVSNVHAVPTGAVVGTTDSQTLTNKSIDGDTNTVTDLAITAIKTNVTDASKFMVRDASGIPTSATKAVPTGVVVGDTDSQTLTNKTLTTPVIDVISATDQGSTPASPSAGTTKVYSKTDGKVYKLTSAGVEQELGAGAGGGSINYISANPDAETATTGWATYKDAAAATPVDGTGGSATLTFTRSTSSPLRGTGSFLITTTAANLQGEGASYDFTLSTADQAKMLSISFDYNIASGTYVTGDMTCYIYDVTNSTVIQPAGYQIQALGSTLPNKHIATFQTSSSGTSYRLIFHRAVSTSSAMTMKIDNVQVGPQVVQYGAPVGDWTAYTPTIAGLGTGSSTATGFWRRVGDSAEIQVRIVKDGSTGSGSSAVTATLPSGLVVDTAKITTNTAQVSLGTWSAYGIKASNTNQDGAIWLTGGLVAFANPGDASGNFLFGSNMTASSYIASNNIRVPITGWSSTVQMSNDTDTRVVAASMNATPTSATFADNANWIFSTVAQDTHGAYNTTTGTYTIQVPGPYSFSGQAGITGSSAGTSLDFYVKKNGTTQKTFNPSSLVTGEQFVPFNCDLNLVAGDAITFRFFTDKSAPAISGGASKNSLNIKRLSGPSAIAASETITASIGLTSAVSPSANAVIKYDTVIDDSHGNYSVSTGLYTINSAGRYRVSVNAVTGTTANIYVKVSGVNKGVLFTATAGSTFSGSATFRCIAGDTIGIYPNAGGTFNATDGTLGFLNRLCIERVGN